MPEPTKHPSLQKLNTVGAQPRSRVSFLPASAARSFAAPSVPRWKCIQWRNVDVNKNKSAARIRERESYRRGWCGPESIPESGHTLERIRSVRYSIGFSTRNFKIQFLSARIGWVNAMQNTRTRVNPNDAAPTGDKIRQRADCKATSSETAGRMKIK